MKRVIGVCGLCFLVLTSCNEEAGSGYISLEERLAEGEAKDKEKYEKSELLAEKDSEIEKLRKQLEEIKKAGEESEVVQIDRTVEEAPDNFENTDEQGNLDNSIEMTAAFIKEKLSEDENIPADESVILPQGAESVFQSIARNFLRGGSSGVEFDQFQDLADEVFYFGDLLSKAEVREDAVNYQKKWDRRLYEPEESKVELRDDNTAMILTWFTFSCENSEKLSEGRFRNKMLAKYEDGKYQITSIYSDEKDYHNITEKFSDEDKKARIKGFNDLAQRYLKAGSSDQSVNQSAMLASKVNYFGENITRDQAIQDIVEYRNKWTTRKYTPESSKVELDGQTRATITTWFSFRCENDQKVVTGRFRSLMKASYDNGEYFITSIRSDKKGKYETEEKVVKAIVVEEEPVDHTKRSNTDRVQRANYWKTRGYSFDPDIYSVASMDRKVKDIERAAYWKTKGYDLDPFIYTAASQDRKVKDIDRAAYWKTKGYDFDPFIYTAASQDRKVKDIDRAAYWKTKGYDFDPFIYTATSQDRKVKDIDRAAYWKTKGYDFDPLIYTAASMDRQVEKMKKE